MVDFQCKAHYTLDDLLHIMQLLRAPGGCPWDRAQTHQSIRRNMLEEAYEVAEAIDQEDPDHLKEELGDVLLQVVFHARMAQEAGQFSFDDVVDGICQKLVFRHPHVFGQVQAADSDQALGAWEARKREEKGQKTAADTLDGVARSLPALMRAEKIQKRASRAGMDYDSLNDAFRDLRSEVDELEDAVKSGTVQEKTLELGDLLFSAVNISRFIGVDAEEALGLSCEKFVRRFAKVEELARQRGIDMKTAGIQKLDELWREIKKSY